MAHFADRLVAAIRAKGNAVCVGLDPRWESLPQDLRTRHGADSLETVAAAFEEFCCRVINIVAPWVPVVKPQALLRGLRSRRVDCVAANATEGATMWPAHHPRRQAERYCEHRRRLRQRRLCRHRACWPPLSRLGRGRADGQPLPGPRRRGTVHSEPRRSGRGIFVLVRTSNPGAGQFQDLDCDGRPLFLHVAAAVEAWARENVGTCGFGDVGAVVGATYPAEMASLRQVLADSPLPRAGLRGPGGSRGGYRCRLPGGRPGRAVNSSRGILFAFQPTDSTWETAIETATRATIADLAAFAHGPAGSAYGLKSRQFSDLRVALGWEIRRLAW